MKLTNSFGKWPHVSLSICTCNSMVQVYQFSTMEARKETRRSLRLYNHPSYRNPYTGQPDKLKNSLIDLQ